MCTGGHRAAALPTPTMLGSMRRDRHRRKPKQSVDGLEGILADLESGTLAIDPEAEDIHTFVEGELTGPAGRRRANGCTPRAAATIRWRWMIRLYLRGRCAELLEQLRGADCGAVPEGGRAQRRRDARLHPPAARAAHHVRPPHDGLCGNVPARHRPPERRRPAHE